MNSSSGRTLEDRMRRVLSEFLQYNQIPDQLRPTLELGNYGPVFVERSSPVRSSMKYVRVMRVAPGHGL